MVKIILNPVRGVKVRGDVFVHIDIEDNDDVENIKDKIAEKISEKIGKSIYAEDFRLMFFGEKLNSSNLEDFKEEPEVTVVSKTKRFDVTKLFGKQKRREKERIFTVDTDQYTLSIINPKITKREVYLFITDKEELILKGSHPSRSDTIFTLSYHDDDFTEFKITSNFINLSFLVETDNFAPDLINYLDEHDL